MSAQVLVIDDEESICELITEVCEIDGIEAASSTDSLKVQECLAQHPNIRLIMLDLNMPGKDGIEVLRDLSAMKFSGKLSMMSGFDESVLSTAGELAKELGLKLVNPLKKPFTVKQVFAILRSVNFDEEQSELDTHHTSPVRSNNGELDIATIQRWLENDQVVMHYQPQLLLKNHEVTGLEALVRLIDDKGNTVYPGAFVDLIENHGLTQLLLTKVIDTVCNDYEQHSPYLYNLNLSINVSALDLDRLTFPDELSGRINDSKINANHLTIEITESRAIKQISTGLDILARLRLKGFHLSIDDFGTGEAVLSHIRKMPYNELKIDKSFVDQITTNPRTYSLTRDLIYMAQHLGLHIVAEGIEDQETALELRNMGCDIAQGYYFAKPMPMPDLIKWIQEARYA